MASRLAYNTSQLVEYFKHVRRVIYQLVCPVIRIFVGQCRDLDFPWSMIAANPSFVLDRLWCIPSGQRLGLVSLMKLTYHWQRLIVGHVLFRFCPSVSLSSRHHHQMLPSLRSLHPSWMLIRQRKFLEAVACALAYPVLSIHRVSHLCRSGHRSGREAIVVAYLARSAK
jgi:hypothetical protein